MTRPHNGSIVLVDWRRGGLPKEPTKIRPSIVVEDSRLFDEHHPNLIVVPLTTNPDLAIPALSVMIEPTTQNGCSERCYALAFNVTSVSIVRTKSSKGYITSAQLQAIREKVALCIGLL